MQSWLLIAENATYYIVCDHLKSMMSQPDMHMHIYLQVLVESTAQPADSLVTRGGTTTKPQVRTPFRTLFKVKTMVHANQCRASSTRLAKYMTWYWLGIFLLGKSYA